jgi:hypothetical protein
MSEGANTKKSKHGCIQTLVPGRGGKRKSLNLLDCKSEYTRSWSYKLGADV